MSIARCAALSEKITVSAGMAGYVSQNFSLVTFKDSILLADKHLYRAKSLGKNRVYGHIPQP
jgi:PleD family two-component response regulator